MLKEVIKEIKKMHELNPQYMKLGCLYDNREKIICPDCIESKNGCREMLRSFEYPPYERIIL